MRLMEKLSAGFAVWIAAAWCMMAMDHPLRAQQNPSLTTEQQAASAPAQQARESVERLDNVWGTLRAQQAEINELRRALAEQQRVLAFLRRGSSATSSQDGSCSDLPVPVADSSSGSATTVIPADFQPSAASSQPRTVSPQEPAPTPSGEQSATAVAGFRFSGDFRLRLDAQLRSGNGVAGPLQNVRSRYRMRLNLDKDVSPQFYFHTQLSTGPLPNGTTNDQDMAGMVAKHLFSIAEAYVDYHPRATLWIRGGRIEEVFADGMRFVWDDDVRFNGFQQIWRIPVHSSVLGLKQIEFRSGEYFLSNPNVVVLSATSPYVRAGYTAGGKVRDANLFHPGIVIQGNLGSQWTEQITADIQLYRNANQIQLASTDAGFPALVNGALGVALAGPATGAGNALAAAGEPRYFARHFQVARLAARFERMGLDWLGPETPAWLDLQFSRNVGTSRLRDAMMISANLGGVRQAGDVRLLYQFAIKDANSMISQFTDDDLGTGSGVNIAVHAFRVDLGLTRFLQWQNLLFLQTGRRASNPDQGLFLPLPRGADRTYRYLGQLAFTF